jgi:AbrB family looped-hinge helix DNA binding protein
MSTTMTAKGQVTVPKVIRDELGLKPGDRVDFVLDGEGGARLRKAGGLTLEEALTRYELPFVSDEALTAAAEEAWAEGGE